MLGQDAVAASHQKGSSPVPFAPHLAHRSWKSMLLLFAYSYLAALLLWLALHLLYGDRWWWLFLLTALAFYLFLPALLLPPLAFATRHTPLWVGFGLAAAMWLGLFGRLYLPHSAPVLANDTTLTVLTYNALYHNTEVERTVAAIRANDADLVAIQELSEAGMHAIQAELSTDYPYQILAPAESTGGMGLLSRYPLTPLHPTDFAFPQLSGWVGQPQLAMLNYHGQQVLVLNIHAHSTSLGYGGPLRFSPAEMEQSVRQREAQMHALAAFARSRPEPLLMLGDFNTGYPSHAHRILSAAMQDAWLVAGHGVGHTFPGANIPGSSRPTVLGVPIPQWLIRLDYIFYSAHWHATHAEIGVWDQRSDHRPVRAVLVLR